MKFSDFQKLLEQPPKPTGYMINWELRENGMLCSNYTPDKHAGEPLIESYEVALKMAQKLASMDLNGDKYVNICVVERSFNRVSEVFNKHPKRMTQS